MELKVIINILALQKYLFYGAGFDNRLCSSTKVSLLKIFLCYKSFAPTELRVSPANVFLQKFRSYGAKGH